MAQIQPYAEAVGAEEIASPLTADNVINLPPTRPDGMPWTFGKRLAEEVLAEADGDYVAIELSPTTKQYLGDLDDLDDQVRRTLKRGFVDVSIAHLRDLPTETQVRIGYRLTFTDAEIERLGL
ncbi:hypothetical protein PSU4_50170 [Pseudonocardia sulfidoxydans NBRC 16205]|uniref:Uncharacterized protein n=1 Tax=Pseudonocardia sulfidoxydans NBRC 16205 TaxID=1223511 RepID=A0A511DP73_9PSEU|nr:hypothetical protein [Pseudonocardia sulfidoxydans]GEL26063.1 hypothetical protein PSU4_50170 [Pseudonocardia sulfidoxydans NBRC 16205]